MQENGRPMHLKGKNVPEYIRGFLSDGQSGDLKLPQLRRWLVPVLNYLYQNHNIEELPIGIYQQENEEPFATLVAKIDKISENKIRPVQFFLIEDGKETKVSLYGNKRFAGRKFTGKMQQITELSKILRENYMVTDLHNNVVFAVFLKFTDEDKKTEERPAKAERKPRKKRKAPRRPRRKKRTRAKLKEQQARVLQEFKDDLKRLPGLLD